MNTQPTNNRPSSKIWTLIILATVVSVALAVYFYSNPSSGPTSDSLTSEDEAMALSSDTPSSDSKTLVELPLTDQQWRERLTQEQYYVTQEKGTERAFTGAYWDNKKQGVYRCVCCGLPLFSSQSKYKSGTGWPSYYQPIEPQNVKTEVDKSLFSQRTEVLCSRCDAHLGHVFDDGPQPTGLRYCLNSAALKFVEQADDQ